jgi:hypothetical protein
VLHDIHFGLQDVRSVYFLDTHFSDFDRGVPLTGLGWIQTDKQTPLWWALMKAFYYGCKKLTDGDQVGHYLYEPGLRSSFDTTPWGHYPDGTLLGESRQVQGECVLTQKDGWTALSFWDRTGDTRGNSNSNFFFEGIYTFEQMVELSKQYFPEIMNRVGTLRLR